jgi:hypothetical protein
LTYSETWIVIHQKIAQKSRQFLEKAATNRVLICAIGGPVAIGVVFHFRTSDGRELLVQYVRRIEDGDFRTNVGIGRKLENRRRELGSIHTEGGSSCHG